jgi:hypothetical protein
MTSTRLFLALALLLQACATTTEAPQLRFKAAERTSNPVVAVVGPATPATLDVYDALSDELESDYDVVAIDVPAGTAPAAFAAAVATSGAVALVVMDNPTVTLLQKAQQEGAAFPPAFVVMASFADEAVVKLKNATGIAYEVPAITSFGQLRSLVEQPVRRVGVIYREGFDSYVEQQRVLAEQEKLEIIGVRLGSRPTPREIRRAVRELRDRGADALWVLNDNGLLRQDQIVDGWKPALDLAQKPVVCGVTSLVNPAFGFGTLALVPDHESLGSQLASIILEAADSEWALDGKVRQPLSVKTTLDAAGAARFTLKSDALTRVDYALQK